MRCPIPRSGKWKRHAGVSVWLRLSTDRSRATYWKGDTFTNGQIIDSVTPKHGNNNVNDTNKRAEPVWNAEQHPGAWRAIWAYSAKRSRRDQKTLYAQEARARAVINGERAVKSTRFVKTDAGA